MATKLTYEQAMEQLEQIVKQLEDGKLPLEQSLSLFETGTKLAAFCSKCLTQAEKKIQRLTEIEAENTQESESQTDEL